MFREFAWRGRGHAAGGSAGTPVARWPGARSCAAGRPPKASQKG